MIQPNPFLLVGALAIVLIAAPMLEADSGSLSLERTYGASEIESDSLIIAHCKGLSLYDAHIYINGLADRKNRRVLLKLAAEDSMISAQAAWIASTTFRDDQIIGYCKTLKVGSSTWIAVVSGLNERPKKVVVPYFIEVCKHGDAKARYYCYQACSAVRWGDLLKYARADLDDTTAVESILGANVTIQMQAKLYVEDFGK
jgi:hypothetical protein